MVYLVQDGEYLDYINVDKVIRIQYGKDEYKRDGAWLTLAGYDKKMFVSQEFADRIVKGMQNAENAQTSISCYVDRG